jgi:transcriptional regulator with XRE-family HTH domain
MSGKQLKAVREKLGLTQAEMAEAVGFHVNSYAKAERDEMAISRTLAKLVLWITATGKPHPPPVKLLRPRPRTSRRKKR